MLPLSVLIRHQLILNLHSYQSDIADRDALVEMLPAVNRHQKICNEAAEHLNRETISASGNEMINMQMLFPPAEKCFDVPAQFINLRDLLRRLALAEDHLGDALPERAVMVHRREAQITKR